MAGSARRAGIPIAQRGGMNFTGKRSPEGRVLGCSNAQSWVLEAKATEALKRKRSALRHTARSLIEQKFTKSVLVNIALLHEVCTPGNHAREFERIPNANLVLGRSFDAKLGKVKTKMTCNQSLCSPLIYLHTLHIIQ